MQKEDILRILLLHKKEWQVKYQIKRIALFGSFARDEASEESDIDLSIETDAKDPFILVHFKEELAQVLQRPIDIVRYKSSMNPYLKRCIEKDAIYV